MPLSCGLVQCVVWLVTAEMLVNRLTHWLGGSGMHVTALRELSL